MLRKQAVLAAAIMLLITAATGALADGLSYPETKQEEVVDKLHGINVPDPYRWLEADIRNAPEVVEWVEQENEVTLPYLEEIPEREAIERRLTELWNYEKYSSPFKVAGRYYFYKNDGLQNHYVLYVVGPDGEPSVVLDPNSWAADGTQALGSVSFSEDGKYMAYSKSVAGSDWMEWFVRRLDTNTDLDDHLQWTKFTGASWTKDSLGFFYARFDAPPPGEEYQALNTDMKLYYHRVGTPQADDVLVYQRPDQPEWGFGSEVSEDGRYLIISVWKGTDPVNQVLVKDLSEPYGMPLTLIDNFDHEYSFLGNDGALLYFKTDLDAPLGRIIAIDIRKPEMEHWREIVPQAEQVIKSVSLTGNLFVVSYLKDALSYVRLFRMDGSHLRDVEFPSPGSAGGFGGKRQDTETFYTFTSFNLPTSIYRYDLITGNSELWRTASVPIDPSEYEVKQVFYTSKDGTRVPMFIAHKRGIKLDGKRPTLLYGYGGFNISMTPYYSVTRMAWMEMGGIFALANLRGGGEYGEEWHKAGTLHQKQNVFDDFIAAAEYLIDNKYTDSDR